MSKERKFERLQKLGPSAPETPSTAAARDSTLHSRAAPLHLT